jgi:hypothetical protein
MGALSSAAFGLGNRLSNAAGNASLITGPNFQNALAQLQDAYNYTLPLVQALPGAVPLQNHLQTWTADKNFDQISIENDLESWFLYLIQNRGEPGWVFYFGQLSGVAEFQSTSP